MESREGRSGGTERNGMAQRWSAGDGTAAVAMTRGSRGYRAGRYFHTLAGGKFSGVQARRSAARPSLRQGSGEVTQ